MKALIDRLFCYYDFGGNSWTSRLGNSKKALVIGICAGPDDNSMGYTIEAMVKPLIDLNINIIKKLTYYNTAKNTIVNNEKYQIKLIEYIEFYNKDRFQKRLGCMAPLEYRNHTSISAKL